MKIRHKVRGALQKVIDREARERNTPRNEKEAARRDARMAAKVRAGSLPYTPAVMSWLSHKLEKPAGRITAGDVKNLLR
jgi:hypothetical protein